MRNRFADVFHGLAKERGDLHLIVADISPAGSIEKFRTEFPERFVNVGVSEQIMIGMAAGMAQRGLRVFCYTIAPFALYRPFEFVRDDLAYQDVPVTVVGIGGGVTYSTLGATHHAHEDIAIATAIPGMQVIAPCDPYEVEQSTKWCAQDSRHPTYLRLGKAGEPDIPAWKDFGEWSFGKLRWLRRFVPQSRDVCIISYGPIMSLSERVADELTEQGHTVSLVSCHTLKPLDVVGLRNIVSSYRRVVVIEETTSRYGLGAQVRSVASSFGSKSVSEIRCFGLVDRFIHCYGSHQDVLTAHGLTFETIIEGLLDENNITRS